MDDTLPNFSQPSSRSLNNELRNRSRSKSCAQQLSKSFELRCKRPPTDRLRSIKSPMPSTEKNLSPKVSSISSKRRAPDKPAPFRPSSQRDPKEESEVHNRHPNLPIKSKKKVPENSAPIPVRGRFQAKPKPIAPMGRPARTPKHTAELTGSRTVREPLSESRRTVRTPCRDPPKQTLPLAASDQARRKPRASKTPQVTSSNNNVPNGVAKHPSFRGSRVPSFKRGMVHSVATASEEVEVVRNSHQLLNSNLSPKAMQDEEIGQKPDTQNVSSCDRKILDKFLESDQKQQSEMSFPRHASQVALPTRTIQRCRRQDCHRNIGEWMLMVDAAVAETVTISKEQPTSVLLTARQSLGTLGLLAADAIRSVTDTRTSLVSPQIEASTALGIQSSLRMEQLPCPRSSDRTLTPRPQLGQDTTNSQNGASMNTADHPLQHTPTFLVLAPAPTVRSNTGRTRGPMRRTAAVRRSGRRPTQSGSTSSLKRPLHQRAGQAAATLLRGKNGTFSSINDSLPGIRLRNAATVLEAMENLDADPNEYLNLSTAHLPWILLAPYQRGATVGSTTMIPSYIRLHPLHLAVAISSYAVMHCLIEGGACVNALDNWNRNPLQILIQPPPIELPKEQHAEMVTEWPAKLTDTLSIDIGPENQSCKRLSNFLYKQAGKRSSNEVQMASLLCKSGIDLTRRDKWGLTCIDYATEWLRISRFIRAGKVGQHWIQQSLSRSPAPQSIQFDCPVPVIRPPDVTKYNSVQLSSRIPHEIVDVILLYEDSLRLRAIAPIVGLDVGGGMNPQRLVRVPNCQNTASAEQCVSVLPLPSTCTPTRPEQSSIPQSAAPSYNAPSGGYNMFTLSSAPRSERTNTKTRGNRRSSYLERYLQTPCQRNLSSITISSPSPGVTRLALRLTPHAQLPAEHPVRKPDTPTQTALAESCLRALQTACREGTLEEKSCNRKVCGGTAQQPNDDLAAFLSLASSPSFRFHSALLGVWEFLGAEVSSNTQNAEEIPQLHCTSPSQPVLCKGRLSEASIRLDEHSNPHSRG